LFRLRRHWHFLTIEKPFFMDFLGLGVAVATALVTFPIGKFLQQASRLSFQDLLTNATLTDPVQRARVCGIELGPRGRPAPSPGSHC
jgi:hypothetical protein